MTAGSGARSDRADVVVIGAGAVGASVAWWLAGSEPGLSVTMVERDPGFATASTSLSAASIRMQFSTPVNVQISRFGIDFIRGFRERLGPEAPDLALREHGYLVCGGPEAPPAMARLVAMQNALGAATELLGPEALGTRFPWISTEGLGGASFGAEGEGWFDATGLRDGLLAAARRLGVRIRHDRVTGFRRAGSRITGVTLASGAQVDCGTVVNAAGPRAAEVAAMAGLELPVEPRKRHCFVFSCPDRQPPRMPLVTDPSGLWVRPEGPRYLAGAASNPDTAADADDFETDHTVWDDWLWPALAHRIPAFERTRVEAWWTGHYAMNTLDANAIVGSLPDCPNLFLANGFSGHGLQQAPAVGRGVAELILHGGFRTLDLGPLGPARLAEGRPLAEAAVI